MSNTDRLAKELSEALKTRRRQPKPYDTKGIVRSIRNGVAYVHFYGGEDETPVALTIDAHVGDEVLVHSGGGRAYIIGNATAPPTDDREAVVAKNMARKADERAGNANVKADEAKEVAANADAKSEDALNLAEGTDEHFWYDNTGAHVTQATQEVYEDDPSTAGGNLLMTSQGMAIRDGTTELASFTGTKARIGKQNAFHVDIDSDSMDFTDSRGNSFAIESQGSQVYGGRMIKTVGEDVSSQVGVSADSNHAYSEIRAAYTPSDDSDYQTAHITLQAISGESAEIAFDVSDMSGSAANWKYGQMRFNATSMTTSVPIVAPNIGSGTTDETSSIASGGDYTFIINFGKTFPSVPSVVCSLVDVKNGSGGAVDAHQVVASVSTITTTSCKIKIHNNGTQARKCKISWIAMSN